MPARRVILRAGFPARRLSHAAGRCNSRVLAADRCTYDGRKDEDREIDDMAAVPPVCEFDWKGIDAILPGVDGNEHQLSEMVGPGGLVVVFICNHCPYVKGVIGRIVRDAGD